MVSVEYLSYKTILNAQRNSNSADPDEKIFNSIIGSAVRITIGKDKKITSIDGTKQIADKISASVENFDPATKSLIQKQVLRLVGDDFIKANVNETLHLLPDSAIHIGDKWIRHTTENSEFNHSTTAEYKLTALEDSTAEIEIQSTVKTADTQSALPSLATSARLEGRQNGELSLHRYSGILQKSRSKTSIKGSVQVQGTEVPITISITRFITAKTL